MELTSVAYTLITMVVLAAGQTGTWESRNDAAAKTVLSQVTVDTEAPQTWYALNEGHVWVSYRAGNGWRFAGTPGGGATLLVTAPEIGGGLFARVGGKVYQSTDGGATWTIQGGLHMAFVDGRWAVRRGDPWQPPSGARAFAVDPSNPDIIYAATGNGVFASSDGGQSWEERNAWLEDRNVVDIRVDPTSTQTLLALTGTNTFHSSNGGRMWSTGSDEPFTSSGRSSAQLARALRVEGDRVVAVSKGGKIAMSDGARWTRYEHTCEAVSLLPDGDAVCANNGTLAVGELEGARFTRPLETGFGLADVLRLRETADGEIAASLNGGGVVVSPDIVEWAVLRDDQWVSDAVKDPQGTGVWFTGEGRGLYMRKSADEGWQRRLDEGSTTAVLFDPGSPTSVLAATSRGKVFRSDDLGWSFQGASNGLGAGRIDDMVADPSGSGALWVAGRGTAHQPGAVWRSRDAGQSWQQAGGDSSPPSVRRLAVDPMIPDVLWAAARSRGLYRTDDGGDSWSPVATGCPMVFDVAVHPYQSEKVVVGCPDGVVRVTEDGGNSWTTSPLEFEGDARAVLITEQHEGSLVVGTDLASVAMATGSGETVSSDRFANMQVDLVAASADAGVVVVYGSEGMYRTGDAGENWEAIGWTDKPVTSIDVSGDGNKVYAYSPGSGLYVKEGDGRWDDRSLPQVRIDECTLRMDKAHTAWVVVWNGRMLLVEQLDRGRLREWYHNGSSWDGRGAMSCTRGDTTYSNLLPSIRDDKWRALAGRFGLFAPEKVNRLSGKAGWEVWLNAELTSSRHLILTRGGDVGVFENKSVTSSGRMPSPARSMYLTGGIHPIILVGTDRGVRVSRDLGATFEEL